MKYLALFGCFLASCQPTTVDRNEGEWRTPYAELLAKHVRADGVSYKAWKADSADLAKLDQVTALIATTTAPKDALTFYLDAYNAWVLKCVLDVYPIAGVLDHDADFFKRENITVAGERMSLDHLENAIIRSQFKEARIHFALNCASRSCPPLRATPYSGSSLEPALQEQMLSYLASTEGATEEDGKLVLSQLFEWFAADFEAASGSVLKFVQSHRQPAPTAIDITYQPYNWTLNEAP